jgi:arylsulfatase
MAGIAAEKLAEPLPGVDLCPVVESPAAKTKRDEMGSLLNYTGTFHWQRKDADKTNLGAPEFDLSYRRLFRGVVWDKYKFARYFAPAEHHIPEDWDILVNHNDLEVYDLEADPHELDNLGADAGSQKDLILDLNAKTNALVAAEIGDDRGNDYPGPIEKYNTI